MLTLKQIFPAIIVIVAIFLLADIPSLLYTIIYADAYLVVQGSVKSTMMSGIVFFFYLIGFLGIYFWTKKEYKHYHLLGWIGCFFVFIATIGIQILWNLGYS